ncbi:DEAD/DEAH box helicase, partial [Candidatus Gracilibacteria bacterium]|nr:DEAD/DEAH box helicase [Candidatus Gracilibacteria bacterium]
MAIITILKDLMLTLPIDLKSNISYKNTGPFFSRAFYIKQLFKTHNHGLVISSESKQLSIYSKILNYLQCNISKLQYENDISNLFFNKLGLYIISSDDYSLALDTQSQLKYHCLDIHVNMEISQEDILEKLVSLGYSFSDFKSAGTYKKSGDSIAVVSPCGSYNYTISTWGDTIDSLEVSEIFHDLARNTQSVKKLYIGGCSEIETSQKQYKSSLGTLIETSDIHVVADHINFSNCYETLCNNASNVVSFDIIQNDAFPSYDLEIYSPKISNLDTLKQFLESHKQVHIYTKNYDTIDNFLEYNNISGVSLNKVKINHLESFKLDSLLVVCDDILSNVFIKKRIRKNFSADMDLLMKINPGDYVVHIDHGIGKFNGIIKKQLGNISKEYIEIGYSGEEKLFVPIMEVARVSKYVGVENPKLTGLGGTAWEKSLKSASQDATKVAAELLEIYSKRQHDKGYSFVYDRNKQSSFINSFKYIYTEDQTDAVDEILTEMSEPHPMDRLLIGDVGFGKTEVAFNAIYNAYINGKQSVLITPLVVLAYEHYEKAIERFADFGIKIGVLTRFESVKNATETMRKLASGQLDLVVGTHKLLSEKIVYKNIGLLVIDEEHKFGVSDKERIKKFKSQIDVLTMSATPIPRSLNMALSNIRSMSSLKAPPTGRKNIETSVLKFNENLIYEACKKEFARDGQVFFIHNRVSNIEHMKKLLLNLFPDRKVAITHGQLPGDALEKRILEFKD